MNRTTPRRILVTLPTINRPERLKLDGILAFAHERHAPAWRIELDFGALSGRPARLAAKAYDGIIAYVENEPPARLSCLSRTSCSPSVFRPPVT